MEAIKRITAFFCFLIILINPAYGEHLPHLEKTSFVTLMENGGIKVETLYRIDPKFKVLAMPLDIFVVSDAINSSNGIDNVNIILNREEKFIKDYQEFYLFNKTFRYIALNKSLRTYTNIMEPNDIYIKYDTKLPLSNEIGINLLEVPLRTNIEMDVNYTLIVQSSNKNFIPLSTYQKGFDLINYIGGNIKFSKTYKSFDINEKSAKIFQQENVIQFNFINVSSISKQEFQTDFEVVGLDSIKESYSYTETAKQGQKSQRMLQHQIPSKVNLVRNPEITIEIDGKSFRANLIERDEYERIAITGQFPAKPFYYFGKSINSDNNTLIFGYILNEGSTSQINYELNYNANEVLSSMDYYNYVFTYRLGAFNSPKYTEYISFKIPKEYIILGTNYESNLITQPLKKSNNINFKFDELDSQINGSLEIRFSRVETEYLNLIQKVNIYYFPLVATILFIISLFIERKLNKKNIILRYFSLIIILAVFIIEALFISKISPENFLEGFWYTYTWIPILIFLISILAKFYIEHLQRRDI